MTLQAEQIRPRRTGAEVKEKIERRMANIDSQPKEIRELVHEYGWGAVNALLVAGVIKPSVIRNIIYQVLHFNAGAIHEIEDKRPRLPTRGAA